MRTTLNSAICGNLQPAAAHRASSRRGPLSKSGLGLGRGEPRVLGLGLGGLLLTLALTLAVSCSKPGPEPTDGPPAVDMAAPSPDLTAPGPRCQYEPAPIPSGVGQPIAAGAVVAGVGEAPLDLPVGTPLGGYTARMKLLGGTAPDGRQVPHAKAFVASAGVQTRPQVRALYLKAGSEPVLLVKADLCVAYDRLVYDLERELSTRGLMSSRGRVIVSTSHTHGGYGTFQGTFHLALGFDLFQEEQYQRLLKSLLAAAAEAIAKAAPARIGIGVWDGWDSKDEIYSDRRGEDNALKGPDGKPIGPHKEQRLLVVRVDDGAGQPLALLTSFPMHGTIGGEDNPLTTTDSTGHVELALEEQFDRKVLVMHLQGPAGDASPRGRGGLGSCDDKQSLCTDFARMESLGQLAAPRIIGLWQGIKTTATAALEVVTRTVPNVRKGVRWNSPMYGIEGQGWIVSFHAFSKYLKVTFFDGASLDPPPPESSKDPSARYLHLHEGDEVDTEQVRDWIRRAAGLHERQMRELRVQLDERDAYLAELEEQLLTLEDGAISTVVRGPGGFHVFLLHEREQSEAEVPPYDEVREYIFRQMLDVAMARQEELFLTELRRGAMIERRI